MSTEDRLSTPRNPRSNTAAWILAAAVIILVGAWYFLKEQQPAGKSDVEATVPSAPPVISAPPSPIEEAPDIPEPQPSQTEQVEEPEPLPPLAESDDYTRQLLLSNVADDEVALWLQTDNLVQKSAAVIDGLARGILLRKIIPVSPPTDKFQVINEDGQLWLDESNYARYDPLVSSVTSIDPTSLAAAFQALRPLLEQATSELGVAGNTVDNRIIAAIDLMLATPEQSGPIALKRESVAYQFYDEELEALPSIQKQLIRIGPKNRGMIKQYLKKLRSALLADSSQQD